MATKTGSSFRLSAIPVALFAHLVAIAVTTLVLVWLLHFRRGLAFKSNDKQKILNLHVLLMIIGFVTIAGEAITTFKTIPGSRNTQKLVHLTLHFIALLAGILGIYTIFKFRNEIGNPHIVSLHSWIGLSTVSLFGVQWLFGFFSWWPRAEMGARAKLAPWHVFFGIVILFMAILSAGMGLVERFILLGLQRSQEALIVNFTGLLILLFGIFVGLAVILPRRY
ncbi:Ascorbate ferrireductase (transmembrane) [Bertholletia excelsa]